MSRDPRFERSAWRWMRAYPRRWRATYGDDLVAILTDVAGDDARRIPAREAAGIVRAGLSLRWREHPSFWPWLAYRIGERRLPEENRFWVMDDLLGALYAARAISAPVLVFVLPPYVFVSLTADGVFEPSWLVIWLVAFALSAFIGRRFRPRRAWMKFIGPVVPYELLSRSQRRNAESAESGPPSKF